MAVQDAEGKMKRQMFFLCKLKEVPLGVAQYNMTNIGDQSSVLHSVEKDDCELGMNYQQGSFISGQSKSRRQFPDESRSQNIQQHKYVSKHR